MLIMLYTLSIAVGKWRIEIKKKKKKGWPLCGSRVWTVRTTFHRCLIIGKGQKKKGEQ